MWPRELKGAPPSTFVFGDLYCWGEKGICIKKYHLAEGENIRAFAHPQKAIVKAYFGAGRGKGQNTAC